RVHWYHSNARLGFWCALNVFGCLASSGQLRTPSASFADLDLTSMPVDVTPLKCARFVGTHTGPCEHRKEWTVVCIHVLQDQIQFLKREWINVSGIFSETWNI